MKHAAVVKLGLVVGLLVGLLPQTLSAQRIHVLLVGDPSDPLTGMTAKKDLVGVTRVFRENVPPDQLNLKWLSPDALTAANIKHAIESDFQVGPRDTFVFYFTGHGGMDDSGQFLGAGPARAYRSQIRQAVLNKRPRLALILTDNPCVKVGHQPKPVADTNRKAASGLVNAAEPEEEWFGTNQPVSPVKISALFSALLLEPRGIVDLSAAAPGQNAYGNSQLGGFFTVCLVAALQNDTGANMTWEDLVGRLKRNVDREFRTAFEPQGGKVWDGGTDAWQTTQTVFAHALPETEP